jgi:hypothetical protein
MINQSLTNSIFLMFLTSLITFLVSAFWFWKNKKDSIEKATASVLAQAEKQMQDRVTELEMKLVALTTAVTPLSAAMQAVFIKELTHFHTPELDNLLSKVNDGDLPDEDEPRLFRLLEERSRDLNGRISDSERDAAIMLPMMMKRVKAERALTAVDIQVVSISTPQESTLVSKSD